MRSKPLRSIGAGSLSFLVDLDGCAGVGSFIADCVAITKSKRRASRVYNCV
jgi:hypothetical protein